MALPGVNELLEKLMHVKNSWCLATSGTEWYAEQCFGVALPGLWPRNRVVRLLLSILRYKDVDLLNILRTDWRHVRKGKAKP